MLRLNTPADSAASTAPAGGTLPVPHNTAFPGAACLARLAARLMTTASSNNPVATPRPVPSWNGGAAASGRGLVYYLIVAKGPKKGLPIPIQVDLFLLGSEKICQLRSAHLSPKHCALVSRDKKVFIRDLHTGKPTLVNDEVVTPGAEWPLHAGDVISAGPLEFMIQMREKPLSQRDLEEWAARCLDVEGERNLLEEDDVFHQPTNASEAAQQMIEKLNAQKGYVMGRLRIGLENDVTTVRFNDTKIVEEGEIAMIKKELCEHLHKAGLRILLDMKNVRRLSSVGVNMVGEFRRWLGPRGSSLALCRVRGEIQGMLRTLHVDLPIFPDKRTAIYERW